MPKVIRKITIRIRRPITIVLAQVPSSSEPDKPPYKIYLDRNNSVSCTCKGWRYRHACSHLTAFRQSIASAGEQLA